MNIMSGFHTKTFLSYDDYMTPKYAWENIQDYIPKDKVIWEAFMGDGKSGKYLEELGFQVIHDKDDFFENNKGEIVISNPPFTKKKEILIKLKKDDKPFILLMPQNTINNNYIREIFKDELQIIVPRKRIQFIKNGNETQNRCNFDCFYYCYKMNLNKDIIFLN
jgi:hypothetical protein